MVTYEDFVEIMKMFVYEIKPIKRSVYIAS